MALSQQTTFRLIGGGDARGLSGDARRVLPPEPALDFFDACLKQHRSPIDLVADPDQVWEVETEGGRPMGLEAHLRTASRERLVSLTDVLVIVSDDDWGRAQQNHGARWTRHLTGGLRASFEDWCGRAGIERRNPHRPLGVRVVVDGSNDTFGHRLGLGPGEFVTGLLPNLYSGPAVASRALISVMVNVPGEWDGYREVVRLYDDQDLLTLGDHWLDNFSHPALGAPALYRLQYHPEEGLVHLTSPDVEGDFVLTRHDGADGSSVYGIVRGDGHVVAWLVLAVVEQPKAPAPTPVLVESVPTIDGWVTEDDATVPDAQSDSTHAWLLDRQPSGDEPVAGPNDPTLEDAPAPAEAGPNDPTLEDVPPVAADSYADRDTISDRTASDPPVVPPPEPPSEELQVEAPLGGPPVSRVSAPSVPATAEATGLSSGLVSVRESGVLLQRVHFRDFMLGYEVYISASGEIGSDLADPAATVQVVGRRVRLFAHVRGVRVSGVAVPVNAAAVLGASTQIDVNGVVLDYHDLSRVRLKGWPYLAEIRRPGSNIHLTPGAVHRIGRDPGSQVRLPDDSHHGNIHWRPEVDAGTVIRSRNGDIPKSRFTLDSIMVASQHAEIDLTVAPPRVVNTAGSCFSFVRRGAGDARAWIGLSRQERAIGDHDTHLEPGDELYIGNCILRVDWSTESEAREVALQPPPVAFSLAEDLPESPFDAPLPPPPLLPVPPVPDLPAPPPLPPSHRDTPPVAPTWVDASTKDDDPTGLPGSAPPAPFQPVAAGESLVEDVAEPSVPVAGPPPPVDSVDDAWSPFSSAIDDDPTAVPLPGFMRKTTS